MSLYGVRKASPIPLDKVGETLGANHPAAVLAAMAEKHGFAPLGCVSASTKRDAEGVEHYIVDAPEESRVYVGPALAFKGIAASPLCMQHADKVYTKAAAKETTEPAAAVAEGAGAADDE